jgi:hypothetical protein
VANSDSDAEETSAIYRDLLHREQAEKCDIQGLHAGPVKEAQHSASNFYTEASPLLILSTDSMLMLP